MMEKLAILFLTVIILGCSNSNSSNKADLNTVLQDGIIVSNTILDSTIVDAVSIADSVVVTKKHFFKNLSFVNNFKLSFYECFENGEIQNHYWKIIIYDKKMNQVDSIHQPVYLLFSDNIDFKKSRSYITGINKNSKVADNYFGDFIVGDFNFDSKPDFAIINDIGGNGGTFYSYYIQQDDNKFTLDTFLTNIMVYFPSEIDSKNKRLITYVHAGVCWLGEHTYELDKTNKWKEISHREIDICEK